MKSNLSKKSLAILLSFAMIASVFCSVGIIPGSAETTVPLPTKASYDFENGNVGYLDFGIANNQTNSNVNIITEEGGNNALKINATSASAAAFGAVIVNFPFELKNNTSYVLEYDLRDDGATQLPVSSGIYAGKSTGITSNDGKKIGVQNYINQTKLHSIKQEATTYCTIKDAAWKHYKYTFTVGDGIVDDDFKYLAFVLRSSVSNTNGGAPVYFDNIAIQTLDANRADYDFEDGEDFLDYGIDNDKDEESVSVKTEESGNKYLAVNTYGYKFALVNFPFVLENNTTYKLSYKIKSTVSDAPFVFESDAKNSGIYVGKSEIFAPVLTTASTSGNNLSDLYKNKLANPYPVNPDKTTRSLNLPADWTEYSCIFTTGEDSVDDVYKQLAMVFLHYKGAYVEFGIDDISIFKATELSFVSNGGPEVDSIAGEVGQKVTMPKPERFGYEFTGWYDENGTTLLASGGATIDCPKEAVTYYAGWEKYSSYTADFASEEIDGNIKYFTNNPVVAVDPDDATNYALKFTSGNYIKYNFVLPVELQAGKSYTVSYRYKAAHADGSLVTESTDSRVSLSSTKTDSETQEVTDYSGSYIGVGDVDGDMKEPPISYLKGKKTVNETDWAGCAITNGEWTTVSKIIEISSDLIDETHKYFLFRVSLYGNTVNNIVYLDDIKIALNPVATFESDNVTYKTVVHTAGETVSVEVPTKSGYMFTGWYLNGDYVGFDKIVMPNEDTVYTAGWKLIIAVGNINADANNDINADDLADLKGILLGKITDFDAVVCDCNGDGSVDILDLVKLKKYLASPTTVTLGKTVDSVGGYQLVWNDEFDGTALSKNYSFRSLSSQRDTFTYVSDADHIYVSDGTLKMVSTMNGDNTAQIPKNIVFDNIMNFKYGYLEFRAKIPYVGHDEWPSFWATSRSAALVGSQEDLGLEVDLLENVNGKLQAQLHLWDSDNSTNDGDTINIITNNTKKDGSLIGDNDWHVYGMRWDENSFTFYLDGQVYASYTVSDIEQKGISADKFRQYIALRIGCMVNDEYITGNYGDYCCEYDYIRLYQIAGQGGIVDKGIVK